MSTVQLPDKVYSMDVVHPLMVVACANRTLQIFDLNNPGVVFKVRRRLLLLFVWLLLTEPASHRTFAEPRLTA